MVDNPVELGLDELRALPHRQQITQHHCIQGWSGMTKRGGVSMATNMDLVKPKSKARWVGFYSLLGGGPDGGLYIRRPPHRANARPLDDAGMRHERRPVVVQAWRPTTTVQ
ncbi:hypothetical protein ACFU6I_09360 [Streptomyces sp. NPDC057486]|uniref:hypothetical protein n=1 Tax=Streptomyces sp. NPDC057486 TaxID=3346145 RepID=UPI0036947F7A